MAPLVVRPVAASVPGKLILAGEHSVVFGRAALVAAIDLRLKVDVAPVVESGLLLNLTDLGYRAVESMDEVRRYEERHRRLWRSYSENPSAESFSRLRTDHPAHLVRLAVARVLSSLGLGSDVAFEVRVSSSIPVGCGLGSSAALGAAVVSAVLYSLGEEPAPGRVEDLALRVEEIQHGRPSGLDTAAVVRGGVLWRDGEAEKKSFVRLDSELAALGSFVAFDTGKPPESTGTVVSWVGERRRREAAIVDVLLDDLEAGTLRLREALEREDPPAIVSAIRALHAALVALGVVPLEIAERVEAIERQGGAAKISGAGSLQGPAAGSLLVYHPQPEKVAAWGPLRGLRTLTTKLGGDGLRFQLSA